MKARPIIHRGTSSRDLSDHGDGYSANGESEHSRRAASERDFMMPRHVAKGRGKRTPAGLIAENESELVRLRGEMLIETNPTRLVKLKRNFEIKSRFVERLKSAR